jgi:uncharacterized protein DUF6745
MARNRSRSAHLDERRRHAEAFVRALPPVPDPGPLTDEERAGIEAAVRRFTARCGRRWHHRVSWARSPTELHELTTGEQRLLLRRGDRIVHALSYVGSGLLLSALITLGTLVFYGSVVGVLVAIVVACTGADPLTVAGCILVASYVCLVCMSLLPRPRDIDRTVRPLRVRMPRSLRPGTPEFRAWMSGDVLGGPGRGPDGRSVLSLSGCAASTVRSGEFLGGPCSRSSDLYPVRFREPLRFGRRRAFDGHLRPQELAWLLERREVAPRRFARTLLRTHTQLERAFAIRLSRDVAVVLEPPLRFCTERLPDGTSRLHCDDGPAVEWASGERLYALHGVRVPADLVESGWNVPRIHAEHDTEVRRIAIDRLGWATYLRRTRAKPVATAPDPANQGRSLRLYRIPDVPAHVLLMSNGSPDRSGAVRVYAELVPPWIEDPTAAAAWQYGVPMHVYSQLKRRT